jgi:hypothetical protein
MSNTRLSQQQKRDLGVLVDKPEVDRVQLMTLTPAQYRRIEASFPIRHDITDPIQAAIALGQQSVLAMLRSGFTQGL